jgi:hypothetical protein
LNAVWMQAKGAVALRLPLHSRRITYQRLRFESDVVQKQAPILFRQGG